MSIINPLVAVTSGFISGVNTDNIQPNSIDLTIEKVYTIKGSLVLYRGKDRELPNYHKLSTIEYYSPEVRNVFKLEPNKRYQVEFQEELSLPHDICALTFVRSTMAKSGCNGENGLYDSGYSGSSGMMVSVQEETFVEVGASLAQIVFIQASSSKLYDGFYKKGPWLPE